jgi:hypothetical protein
MREWEISIHGTLDSRKPWHPSGQAGMDGAVASLRYDAFGHEDGRRAASASATRPSSACYRVWEVLPPSHQHPTAGGGRVLLTEPPARKRPPGGHAEQAEVDFALQPSRGGAEVLEVLEAHSTLLVLVQFGGYSRY